MDASVDASISSKGSVHVVKCGHLSGLMMRLVRRRGPLWRCADRVQDHYSGLESPVHRRWWRDRSAAARTGRAAAEANGRSCSTACGIRRQNEWDSGLGSTRALTRRGHEVAVESARERCEGRHVCGSVSIEARKRAPTERAFERPAYSGISPHSAMALGVSSTWNCTEKAWPKFTPRLRPEAGHRD